MPYGYLSLEGHVGDSGEFMPGMSELNGSWRQLELVRRIEFVLFADEPVDEGEASAALAFARRMDGRIRLWALVSAFGVYVAVILMGSGIFGAAVSTSISIAFILGFAVALTVEVTGKGRARRLAARARQARPDAS